jgi:hypothetical protein
MGTLMETYNELVLSLGQLGVEVKIEPRLTPRGICVNLRARRHAMVLLKQEGDLIGLAHEAVHVLQYLYCCFSVGLPLVGLNPLQFNPNLRGNTRIINPLPRSQPPQPDRNYPTSIKLRKKRY